MNVCKIREYVQLQKRAMMHEQVYANCFEREWKLSSCPFQCRRRRLCHHHLKFFFLKMYIEHHSRRILIDKMIKWHLKDVI